MLDLSGPAAESGAVIGGRGGRAGRDGGSTERSGRGQRSRRSRRGVGGSLGGARCGAVAGQGLTPVRSQARRQNATMDAGGGPLLPDSVLYEIFLYLDHVDVLSVGLVCQQWHAVARDEFLWKELFYRYYRISREVPRHPGARPRGDRAGGSALLGAAGSCPAPGPSVALRGVVPV